MRTIMLAIPVLAVISGPVGRADATTMWIPSAAQKPTYLPIAEMEMTVTAQTADLRAHPSPDGKVLGKLTRGTKVTVLETVSSGEWAHVRVNNKEGYIFSKYLK
jgi:uncharacterized protein YgiM (DUF1202 family)